MRFLWWYHTRLTHRTSRNYNCWCETLRFGFDPFLAFFLVLFRAIKVRGAFGSLWLPHNLHWRLPILPWLFFAFALLLCYFSMCTYASIKSSSCYLFGLERVCLCVSFFYLFIFPPKSIKIKFENAGCLRRYPLRCDEYRAWNLRRCVRGYRRCRHKMPTLRLECFNTVSALKCT